MELQKPRRHTKIHCRPSVDPENPENHLGRYVQDPRMVLVQRRQAELEVDEEVVQDAEIARLIVRDELDKLQAETQPSQEDVVRKAAQLALLDEYLTEKFGEPPETNQ